MRVRGPAWLARTLGREGTRTGRWARLREKSPSYAPAQPFVQRPSFFIQNSGRRRAECNHFSALPCGVAREGRSAMIIR